MTANAGTFCTCTDLECPLHPANHDKGCDLCIKKNLAQKEIPSCFFKKASDDPLIAKKGTTFERFADVVRGRDGAG